MKLPARQLLTGWTRFLASADEKYVVSDRLTLFFSSRYREVSISQRKLVFSVQLRLNAVEAVILARLLLRIVESLAGADRVADIPEDWLDGFSLRNRAWQPTIVEKAVSKLVPAPTEQVRAYDLGQRRKLVAYPGRSSDQLTIFHADENGSWFIMHLEEGEVMARIILTLLGQSIVRTSGFTS